MKRSLLVLPAIFAAWLLMCGPASALTMNQFSQICGTAEVECSEHPILRAYVGGALDIIAVLDEESDYLGELYCKDPTDLFDVPSIIRYMQTHQEAYATRNAMLLVVQYLEEKGGC